MKEKMMHLKVAVGNEDNVVSEFSIPAYMRPYIGSFFTPFHIQYFGKAIHLICNETGEVFTRYGKKFTGNREWDFWNCREVCIKYDLFTNGDCKQYEKFFEMVEDGDSFNDLMLVVWICSNRETLQEVKDIFYKEFLPR